jgi:glycosyltransferase involved in cell wall biosynthesis
MHYTIDARQQNKNPTWGDRRSVRILQVVGGMNRGGIETWLMHILRHIDRDRVQMDFLVHTTQAEAYDDEIRALGCPIIPCLEPSRPWIYASNFKQLLDKHGPYDIVHSHLHHFNGYVLRLARQAGVPVRIAHTHTDTSSQDAKAGWFRRLYLALMKRWIARYATFGMAINREAAAGLFGVAWETDPRWRVFDCGIDLTPFHDVVDPIAVRAELGIPEDAFVIGHVGRFVTVKNHTFIVDIASEVAQREPKLYLLLVGDGPLRPDIEQKVAQMGLCDRVIFAGIRSDVHRLMLGAMDVFLFPSLYEGMGNVRLEAQAAGVYCVVSDTVPEEGDVVKPLVQRMSLSQPACQWAEAILAAKEADPGITQAEALRLVEQSSFNIQTTVKDLQKRYLDLSSLQFPKTLLID